MIANVDYMLYMANVIASQLMKYCQDVRVCGSVALIKAGIKLGRVPHDIDVEVICSDKQYSYLKYLEKFSKGELTSDENCVSFIYSNSEHSLPITVNVWRRKNEYFSENSFMVDGITYSTVDEVLRWKKKYNRAKDNEDLRNIIKYIVS